MFSYIADTLRANPQLAIFFTLAIGYWIGARKFGSFSLGAVTGTLLAGIVIGQLGIDISGQVKSVFFIMFLFAVGFGVGPQFVRGIATDGLPQALFAVVVSVLCLLSVYYRCNRGGLRAGTCCRTARRRAHDFGVDRPCHRRDQHLGPDSRTGQGRTRPHPRRLCDHLSLRHGGHRLDSRLSRTEAPRRRPGGRVRPL